MKTYTDLFAYCNMLNLLIALSLYLLRPEPTVLHSGFLPSDPRQEMVAEAYNLWGLDFISMIECENGSRDPTARGDWGKAYGLCQLNTRRHKEPLAPERKDWRNQISICYHKGKLYLWWYEYMLWVRLHNNVSGNRV